MGKIFESFVRDLLEGSYWLRGIGIIGHSNLQRTTSDNALNIKMDTLPLGRKSRPTICSMRLLLPELCEPMTQILGSLMYCSSLMSLSRSMSETTPLSCPPKPVSMKMGALSCYNYMSMNAQNVDTILQMQQIAKKQMK